MEGFGPCAGPGCGQDDDGTMQVVDRAWEGLPGPGSFPEVTGANYDMEGYPMECWECGAPLSPDEVAPRTAGAQRLSGT